MKKYIAPVIIGIIMLIYFSTIGLTAIFSHGLSILQKLLIAFIPMCLACLSTYVMIERIHEIKGGEEDDARKY